MDMNKIFSKVFLWMFIGLAITFGIAYYVSTNDTMVYNLFSGSKYWIFWIIEFVVVVVLSAGIRKFNPFVAKILFLLYSGLTGLTLSSIFIFYDIMSIVYTFAITSGLFLIFGLVGYFTKLDLTKIGIYLVMALFGIIIASIINLRLRIAYSFGRLRNLQDESAAESVPSTCYINNPDLAGKNGTGGNIKYDCNATTTYNATDITNVTINTDVPLKADNQSFSFENVTFNGNSSEEAANLVEATDQVEGDPIDIRDADITVEDNKVVFSGTVRSDEGASTAKAMYDNKETFTMLLSDFSSGEEKFEEYDCQISSYTADGDNGKVDMTCKTPNKNLKNPIAFNFDDSLSIGERVVTLHMKEGVSTPVNWEVVSTDTDKTTDATKTDAVNNISYRKNSSGLSGGAIAGIVIACAVVLIAASIVAMMLRKPAPPLDNTTVVGLKTVDNY